MPSRPSRVWNLAAFFVFPTFFIVAMTAAMYLAWLWTYDHPS